MTEAVIALPVLILLLAGCGYIHGLYRGRLAAQHRAAAQAWTEASAGCEGRPWKPRDELLAIDEAVDRLGPRADRPNLDRLGRADGTAQVTAVVPRVPGVGGGPTRELHGHARVTCNERPSEPPDFFDAVSDTFAEVVQ